MKSVLQAILLFFFIIFEVHGASLLLRDKRQSHTELPQIGEQRDPLRYWQQVPQLNNQNQPSEQQSNQSRQKRQNVEELKPVEQSQQNRQGRIFGGKPIDNDQSSSNETSDENQTLYYGHFAGFGGSIPTFFNPPQPGDFQLSADGSPGKRITALLLAIPTLRPTESNSAGSVSTTTTTTPSTSSVGTTPSPEYLRCLSNCPTTMEYNPVCGSDARAYHNEHRLRCANQCGNNVQMVRRGTCLPL